VNSPSVICAAKDNDETDMQNMANSLFIIVSIRVVLQMLKIGGRQTMSAIGWFKSCRYQACARLITA
jgi:hypothetical protein